MNKRGARKKFLIFFALYASHIGLDYFSIDSSVPQGVPFWWPLSNAYYIAPVAFLPDIRRASVITEFIPSLFSLHNLWAMSVECFVMIPFVVYIVMLAREKPPH